MFWLQQFASFQLLISRFIFLFFFCHFNSFLLVKHNVLCKQFVNKKYLLTETFYSIKIHTHFKNLKTKQSSLFLWNTKCFSRINSKQMFAWQVIQDFWESKLQKGVTVKAAFQPIRNACKRLKERRRRSTGWALLWFIALLRKWVHSAVAMQESASLKHFGPLTTYWQCRIQHYLCAAWRLSRKPKQRPTSCAPVETILSSAGVDSIGKMRQWHKSVAVGWMRRQSSRAIVRFESFHLYVCVNCDKCND